MDTEFEVKFYPVNKDDYRKKLKAAGAKLVAKERTMRRIIFDYRDQTSKFACDYLRVRDEGDVVRLSAKTHAREDGNIADQKEVDVVVADFDKTVQILHLAGLKSNRFQITKRETWQLDECEIVIDSWPWLESYTEIEGPSEEAVKSAAQQLDFDWQQKIVTSVTEIYMKLYNLDEQETLKRISNITFEQNPFEGLEEEHMIDIQLVRDNPEKIKAATDAKRIDGAIVDKLVKFDEKRRNLIKQIEELRSERNKIAKEGKASDRGKEIKEELKKLEPELAEINEKFENALRQIPNPAADDVKVGKDDSENEIIDTVGEPRKFDFEPRDHVDLGLALGIIDIDRAVKVSGARFYYLKGDGAKLEWALLQFAAETLEKHGFTPVVPPVLIKKEMMAGMGYLEHGGEEDMYTLDKDGLVLVGTSEQSIGPMHANEVLDVTQPIRYMGFSPCFRREAGSYGKDTRGILRVHQFDKVEMFSFTKVEDSDKEHDFLRDIEEKFLQALGLPYQVIKQCTGDLGAPAARKYDLEAWIPTQGKYRELTSTSTCTDFQSRGLNIRYKEGAETKYVHMLNGTAFAMGRTIIAIMENYQNEDGSIDIPEVLRKYIGKDRLSR